MSPTVATKLELGGRSYDITYRALVMGILNRTPDSFFDGGEYFEFDAFLAKAEAHVTAGADCLDVGGVKAGPGVEVTPSEELDRVVPAVEALVARFDLPISVDTFRASVAQECYRAGAVVGNDISGFADPDYLRVAAEHGASVVACHIRLAPRVPDPEPHYDDLRGEVCAFLSSRAEWALRAGIPSSRIMLDAGLDLGKTEKMSATLLGTTDDLTRLGFPVFLSASNKRFLGELTGTETEDRNYASHSAHVIGIVKGARILRAHDVAGSRRVADVTAAILEKQ
ncbi:MAG: dihydropteroate synthase [Acidobacteria bacterium]|nr:dihydropteroate synthase [Acidobacteriota bacterium]